MTRKPLFCGAFSIVLLGVGCSKQIDNDALARRDLGIADASQALSDSSSANLDGAFRSDLGGGFSDASVASYCFEFDNPSFEDPFIDVEVGSVEVPGWTQVEGNVDILLSGGYYGVAADGRNFIDINGTAFGVIEQTHPTIVGATYEFTVSVAANGSNRPFKIEVIDDNGDNRGTESGTGIELPRSADAWRVKLVRFTATTPMTTVRFRSDALDDPNRGAMVDHFTCSDTSVIPDDTILL